MIKKTARTLFGWLNSKKSPKISAKQIEQIDREALQILERLKKAGHESYLVGGCVRDILLGKKPKDFDIATRATPQQVKSLIHRSFIIGKRFRIVVAKRRPDPVPDKLKNHPFLSHAPRPKEKEFQITTFRRAPVVHEGKINENVFGEPAEDAQRRDFTINGLFLDVQDLKVVDFVGGLEDLNSRSLRMIGDPASRFEEDPIRILRALRFLHRAKLKWDSATLSALKKCVPFLANSKKERVREELVKMLREGTAHEVFRDMEHFHIWPQISAEFPKIFGAHQGKKLQTHLISALAHFAWPDEMDTVPLFFLLTLPALIHHQDQLAHHLTSSVDALFNDLKVSKKEREGLERLLAFLNRIKRDPRAQHPDKMLVRNPKVFEGLNRGFYVLKLFAAAGDSPYSDIYGHWERAWLQYSQQMKRSPQRHHSRGNRRQRGSSSHSGGHSRRVPPPKPATEG